MRLRSERIVTPSGTVAGELVIRDRWIESLGPPDESRLHDAQQAIDLGASWLVPGYIDTHVHGGGGAQCNTSDPGELAAVAEFHAAHGTTALLATTVSAPVDDLIATLEAVSQATHGGRGGRGGRGAAVLGAHLEGPFLSAAQPGAMDPQSFLAPDPQTVERLLAASRGTLRWMTFAPELPGAGELVSGLVRAGVVASIGHSDATYDQALAAVRAGARAATHTFNAMRAFHHREPGVLGAVLDRPEVSTELICDGVHVDPAAVRLAYRCKGPDAIRLVTDAMAGAGMPDGEYRLGSAQVAVAGGRARRRDSGAIAASTLTMEVAVTNAVRMLGCSVEDAVALASTNPARMLGLDQRKGAIAAGMDADLVVLDDDLAVRATLVGGGWAGGHPPA